MGRLVYSTDQGRLCPDCRQVTCQCSLTNQAQAGDGYVRISYETKGRKGKGATVITGIPLSGKELKALHKELKQKISTGGTIKNGVLELQGDQREKVLSLLGKHDYPLLKLSGG